MIFSNENDDIAELLLWPATTHSALYCCELRLHTQILIILRATRDSVAISTLFSLVNHYYFFNILIFFFSFVVGDFCCVWSNKPCSCSLSCPHALVALLYHVLYCIHPAKEGNSPISFVIISANTLKTKKKHWKPSAAAAADLSTTYYLWLIYAFTASFEGLDSRLLRERSRQGRQQRWQRQRQPQRIGSPTTTTTTTTTAAAPARDDGGRPARRADNNGR